MGIVLWESKFLSKFEKASRENKELYKAKQCASQKLKRELNLLSTMLKLFKLFISIYCKDYDEIKQKIDSRKGGSRD